MDKFEGVPAVPFVFTGTTVMVALLMLENKRFPAELKVNPKG